MNNKTLERIFWWSMVVVLPLALVGVVAVIFVIYAVFYAPPIP